MTSQRQSALKRLRTEPVTPFTTTANAALVAALAGAQTAYESLAREARQRDKTGYDGARAEITRSQAQLQTALDGLRKRGFAFG